MVYSHRIVCRFGFMFLWNSIVYGPVFSRRLGYSLGLNILPTSRKVCNFNCVYCECGLNDKHAPKEPLPTIQHFTEELRSHLAELKTKQQQIDHFTFAGNGEPTLHPEFREIITSTRELRDEFYPTARVAVLSDAATLQKPSVVEALQRVDKPILKLDAGSEAMFQSIDQPETKITLAEILDLLAIFEGRLIIQSLFLRGTVDGRTIDNTSEQELSLLIDHYRRLKPEFVMVYPIDRVTPYATLERLQQAELQRIAERIRTAGIEAEWYG